MGRIGVLGGTFDPPHVGHLAMAESARQALKLNQVLFLPVGQPVHKRGVRVTPAPHRVAMTRLAVADNPAFHVDTTDADRPPPHTTVSLLPLLQSNWPGQELWLIIGADSLEELATWVNPREVIRQARIAMIPRPGHDPILADLEQYVPGVSERVHWVDAPALNISSTDIRRRVARGQTGRYLMPDDVLRYQRRHALYMLDSPTVVS